MTWMLWWKIVLVVAVASFAVLAVIVTIGGARDIRRLFAKLGQSDDAGPPR